MCEGSEAKKKTSSEVYRQACGPCKVDQVDIFAKYFCDNCNEYLCDFCQDTHRKLKISIDHKVLRVPSISKPKITQRQKRDRPPCTCSESFYQGFYCDDHDDFICNSCKTIKHASCQTCIIRELDDIYLSKIYRNILEKSKILKRQIQKIQMERGAYRRKLKGWKQECRNDVDSFRNELVSFIGSLNSKVIRDMNLFALDHEKIIESQNNCLRSTMQTVVSDCSRLENAKRERDTETILNIAKQMREHGRVLDALEIDAVSCRPVLYFQRNQNLIDMQNSIKSVGTLRRYEVDTSSQVNNKQFVDMTVQSSDEKVIEYDDDYVTPIITSCKFMPDGFLVLCDNNNDRIMLLDNDFNMKSNHRLDSSPWDLAVLDQANIVVTVPKKMQLLHIQVFPKMETTGVIQLNRMCWGIAIRKGFDVYRDEILTTCHDNPGNGEIITISLNGREKSNLDKKKMGSYTFEAPCYITLSNSGDKIYVSDWQGSTVTCLKRFFGGVLYRFSESEKTMMQGLLADSDDNILVCDMFANSVHIINNEGKKGYTLVSSDNGIQRPYSVAFRERDNTLVVGGWAENSIFCFRLS